MAVEYEISSDVAVIKETGSVSQCARVTQMYSGQITYDDEAGSKFATATINGKSQRVMLCIAVSGTVNYDDVPSLYSTVDGHRCLNIVTPTETGTPDDVPSLYETVVIDGQNVRAVRCIMINKTPVYDGVSSVCTFTGDDGKTHTAQLVNKVTGGSVEVIIKGTSPLNLPDAIANSLSYVKAFGGTEQIAENYIDSVTVEGKCEQGLPSGYTAIEYVENTSGTYVDLGVAFNDEDSYMSVTADAVNDTNYIFCARDANAMQGIAGTSSAFKAYIDPVSLTSTTTKTAGHKYNFTFTANNGNATFTTEDETATTGDTQTTVYTVSQTQPTAHLCLFGNTYGNVSGVGMKIYGATYTVAGVPVRKMVPARKGAQIGLFDLVSRQFFTATQGSLMAGQDTTIAPTPSAPLDIWCNNGVLKLSPNLANEKATNWDVFGSSGRNGVSLSDSGYYSVRVRIKENGTIPAGCYVGLGSVLDGGSEWNTSGWLIANGAMNSIYGGFYSREITGTQLGLNIFGVPNPQTFYDNIEVMLVKGQYTTETMPPYQNYGIYIDGTVEVLTDSAGNTASVQNLLSVGNYKDTQEILSGAVTRNVGVKVFDGTENWVWDNPLTGMFCNYSLNPEPTTDRSVLCNQFRTQSYVPTNRDGYCVKSSGGYIGIGYNALNGDSTAFKAYLAQQYAAGTPVIVVYPLATPTTESVAGQVLNKTPVTQTTGSVTTAITTTASDHSTPSPTQPLDINTNNGVIAFRDTKLPSAYRRILGMTMNNDCYYEITGFKMNGSDTLRFSFTRTGANACNVLGAYDGTSAQSNYSLYAGAASNASYLRYNGGTYNSYAIADKKYDVVITPTGSDGMETDSTWDAKTFTSTGNLCIGITSPSATSSKMVGSIHGTVVVDGRLELIPCERVSDGGIGYYDTNSGTFYEPIGTTPTSLGYDYTHCGIVTSGPIETINVHGKNLFDISTAQILFKSGLVTATKTDTGYVLENPNTNFNFIMVGVGTVDELDGKTIAVSCSADEGVSIVYSNADGSDRSYVSATTTTISKVAAGGRTNVSLRLTANLSQGTSFTYNNIQVELGSTATDYAPYYDGGTATAEMLLKVSDYQDVQSILDGVVTRNVGVKVLDGTESWTNIGGNAPYALSMPDMPTGTTIGRNNVFGFCSHFQAVSSNSSWATYQNMVSAAPTSTSLFFRYQNNTSTLNDFKQYLADQYAAGTPVIVIYPLETPTTESVAGQTLQVTDGDNVLEITQASLNNLELEAQYNAAVSLTIQEVQDANLDNNVTVTIQ